MLAYHHAMELRRDRRLAKSVHSVFFFFQAEDGIRDLTVTGVQTCALPISQFDLMHSLRSLQARHPALPRLGQATRPKDEPLRLGQDPSLAFAPATIAEILPDRKSVV